MAGEYPRTFDMEASREKLSRILDCGVTSFLDLTSPHDGLEAYHGILPDRKFRHRQLTIRDMDVPTVEQMKDILAYLEAELEEGQCVYVHCWGGIGRTGTVMGCYWVESGLTGEQALAKIAEHWQVMAKRRRFPHSPQTEAQLDFVRSWSPTRKAEP
jgi:protein-tyrosine phosphatase